MSKQQTTKAGIIEFHKIHDQIAITSLITEPVVKCKKNHLIEYYPSFKESEKQSITEANYRYSDRQHSTGDYSKVVLIYSKKVVTCIKDKWW